MADPQPTLLRLPLRVTPARAVLGPPPGDGDAGAPRAAHSTRFARRRVEAGARAEWPAASTSVRDGDTIVRWTPERLEMELWPAARAACERGLLSVGFTRRSFDRFGWPIGRELTGIVSLRPPVIDPARAELHVVATCGIRVTTLERLYDEIACEAGIKWYAPDPNRHSFYTGFSEVWTFRAGGDHDSVSERMGTVVWEEAGALFQAYQGVDEALAAVASRTVLSRFDCEVVPLALFLLGRFTEAERYLEGSIARFACDEDASEYGRFVTALKRRMR